MAGAACDMGPPAKMRRLGTDCFENHPERLQQKTSLRNWPDEVGDLQDALLAKFGVSSSLSSFMSRKIWTTSAYSGIGTFEHVFSRLAAWHEGGLGMSSHFGPFRFYSAFECDPKCQEMLMKSAVHPMHLFANVEQMCAEDVVSKLRFIVQAFKKRADQAKVDLSGPKLKKELESINDRCMRKLFHEVKMAGVNQKVNSEGYCLICRRMCPFLPRMAPGDLRLEIGGNPCVAFSPQGVKDRWCHDTAVAASIWLVRTCDTNADFVLQECSHMFPTADAFGAAFAEKDGWSTSVLALSPTDIAIPFRRPRNFSWTIGPRFRLKIPCSVENFVLLCGGEVVTAGHQYFCMNEPELTRQLLALGRARHVDVTNMPRSQLGVSVLPAGARKRLQEYNAKLEEMRQAGDAMFPIFDLSQNMSVRKVFSDYVPSVLTGSLLFSSKLQRELLISELFRALGWPCPVNPDDAHEEFPWTQEMINGASNRRHFAKMLGNSIHCHLLGMLVAFVLMIAEDAPDDSSPHPQTGK